MKTKRADQLKRGDVVVTEEGEEVRLTEDPSNGVYRGHVHLKWRGSWSEVPKDAEVEVR
jgi:hypothetical protein